MTETPRPAQLPGTTIPRRVLTPAEARELTDLFVDCGTAEARYEVAARSGQYDDAELASLRRAAGNLQEAMFRWIRDHTVHTAPALHRVRDSRGERVQQDGRRLVEAYQRGELPVKQNGLISESVVKRYLAPCGSTRARAAQQKVNDWIAVRRQP